MLGTSSKPWRATSPPTRTPRTRSGCCSRSSANSTPRCRPSRGAKTRVCRASPRRLRRRRTPGTSRARARGLFMEGSAVASSGGARGRVGGFGPGVGSNDGGSSAGPSDLAFFRFPRRLVVWSVRRVVRGRRRGGRRRRRVRLTGFLLLVLLLLPRWGGFVVVVVGTAVVVVWREDEDGDSPGLLRASPAVGAAGEAGRRRDGGAHALPTCHRRGPHRRRHVAPVGPV